MKQAIFPSRNVQALVLLLCCVALLVSPVPARAVGSQIERLAESVAGTRGNGDSTVEEALSLIQHGNYTLALVRLGSSPHANTGHHQARLLTAYALLLAGDTIGAFDECKL